VAGASLSAAPHHGRRPPVLRAALVAQRELRVSVEKRATHGPKITVVDDRTLLWLEIATFVLMVLLIVLA
jgi:hypothetical protein